MKKKIDVVIYYKENPKLNYSNDQTVVSRIMISYNCRSYDEFITAAKRETKEAKKELTLLEYIEWLMVNPIYSLSETPMTRNNGPLRTYSLSDLLESKANIEDYFLSYNYINVKYKNVVYNMFSIKHKCNKEMEKTLRDQIDEDSRLIRINDHLYLVSTFYLDTDFSFLDQLKDKPTFKHTLIETSVCIFFFLNY